MPSLKYKDPVSGAWVYIPTAGPQGPPGPPGADGTGSGGTDEVWIGADEPTNPDTELWYDTDATPTPRTLNAQTGTTYTPILTDENQMVTLSNAAAITVTLPQDSAVAFAVVAEVDFLWLGVGQVTFVAGTGATVNGTPGLKLRARYSAATAKKIAANTWVVIGDLSAT